MGKMSSEATNDHCVAQANSSTATRSSPPSCSVSELSDGSVENKSTFTSHLYQYQNDHLLFVASICVAISAVLFVIFRQRQRRRSKKSIRFTDPASLERKRDFLSRSGDPYGYEKCPLGHIDTWRPQELPHLIPPIHDGSCSISTSNTDIEREVYLDYAGAALPTKTQLGKILKSSQRLLANPHSTGPAASRASLQMEQAKARALSHFGCLPGRFAGLQNPPDSCTPSDCHPGYDVVWTSGATESLRIVAERFPWKTACKHCGAKGSTLVYSQNSHTSVVGMRGPALANGAAFQCHSLSDICNADNETIHEWSNTTNIDDCRYCRDSAETNLLVFPLQCNFGGDKANPFSVIQTCRQVSNDSKQWYTMLDLAKAASSEPIVLTELDPDFACISFYKVFGEPTGLGALFVRRSAIHFLTSHQSDTCCSLNRYFGGGSVDAIMAGSDFAVPRTAPSPLDSLSNGSIHFRGIASLLHGFDELDRLGGMEAIRTHTTSLAAELVRRLKALRHGNGSPAIVIYGAWAKIDDSISEDTLLLPGPTVAFNVIRSDGSFVGYNEVSKLAGLNRPPLQLRTGCFCNPGACQEALQLSDDEIRNNYLTSNHVCGDHIDIINDKPTGAIRASFGKDSMWEDLDALVMFLAKRFVDERIQSPVMVSSYSVSEVQLSEMYIFPIKSCSAQRVKRWSINTESGRLAFDREFALVDSSGTAMRLQSCPRMGSLEPVIDMTARTMIVRAPGCRDLVILLDDKSLVANEQDDSIIKVCGNKCGGRLWGDLAVSDWFSSFLGVRCWLARHCGDRYEVATGSRVGVAFANEAPLLLLSQHSVENLNKVLMAEGQEHVTPRHFRPNLVVRATASGKDGVAISTMLNHANPEDRWKNLSVVEKHLMLDIVGQCARCSMVDIDPITGAKQKTLRALADYRQNKGKITFGVFLRLASQQHATRTILWLEEGDTIKCT